MISTTISTSNNHLGGKETKFFEGISIMHIVIVSGCVVIVICSALVIHLLCVVHRLSKRQKPIVHENIALSGNALYAVRHIPNDSGNANDRQLFPVSVETPISIPMQPPHVPGVAELTDLTDLSHVSPAVIRQQEQLLQDIVLVQSSIKTKTKRKRKLKPSKSPPQRQSASIRHTITDNRNGNRNGNGNGIDNDSHGDHTRKRSDIDIGIDIEIESGNNGHNGHDGHDGLDDNNVNNISNKESDVIHIFNLHRQHMNGGQGGVSTDFNRSTRRKSRMTQETTPTPTLHRDDEGNFLFPQNSNNTEGSSIVISDGIHAYTGFASTTNTAAVAIALPDHTLTATTNVKHHSPAHKPQPQQQQQRGNSDDIHNNQGSPAIDRYPTKPQHFSSHSQSHARHARRALHQQPQQYRYPGGAGDADADAHDDRRSRTPQARRSIHHQLQRSLNDINSSMTPSSASAAMANRNHASSQSILLQLRLNQLSQRAQQQQQQQQQAHQRQQSAVSAVAVVATAADTGLSGIRIVEQLTKTALQPTIDDRTISEYIPSLPSTSPSMHHKHSAKNHEQQHQHHQPQKSKSKAYKSNTNVGHVRHNTDSVDHHSETRQSRQSRQSRHKRSHKRRNSEQQPQKQHKHRKHDSRSTATKNENKIDDKNGHSSGRRRRKKARADSLSMWKMRKSSTHSNSAMMIVNINSPNELEFDKLSFTTEGTTKSREEEDTDNSSQTPALTDDTIQVLDAPLTTRMIVGNIDDYNETNLIKAYIG